VARSRSPARTRGSQCGRVVPHLVEGQGRDREPLRPDLLGLGRLAGPVRRGEDLGVHIQDGCAGKGTSRGPPAPARRALRRRLTLPWPHAPPPPPRDSPGSTCPPSPTILPVPSPVFLRPRSTSRVPSPPVLVSRQRHVDVRDTSRLSQTGAAAYRTVGIQGGGDRVCLRRSAAARLAAAARSRAASGASVSHRADGGRERPRVPLRDEQRRVLPGQAGGRRRPAPPRPACPRGSASCSTSGCPSHRLGSHEHGRGGEPGGDVIAVPEEYRRRRRARRPRARSFPASGPSPVITTSGIGSRSRQAAAASRSTPNPFCGASRPIASTTGRPRRRGDRRGPDRPPAGDWAAGGLARAAPGAARLDQEGAGPTAELGESVRCGDDRRGDVPRARGPHPLLQVRRDAQHQVRATWRPPAQAAGRRVRPLLCQPAARCAP